MAHKALLIISAFLAISCKDNTFVKSAHQYHQMQIYLESLLMMLILTDG